MSAKLCRVRITVFTAVCLSLSVHSAGALMIPPDPFDATDRYALLTLAPDGRAVAVTVKVKSPRLGPLDQESKDLKFVTARF